MDANKSNKYFAFISYASDDKEWAEWLEHELRYYHLPLNIDTTITKTNHNELIRDNLRDVFRDTSRLSAGGDLNEKIKESLRNTTNLIIICSPNSANEKEHPWVDKEVRYFIEDLGKTIDHVFPFIVKGEKPNNYFPKKLRELRNNGIDLLGGNVMKEGTDAAFVKIVSGMLDVDFDSLWQQYEREKAEEQRKEREKRDALLRAQSRFVAEKAMDIAEVDSYLARLLAIEVLPEKLDDPNRPYTVEAERALRLSMLQDNTFFCEIGFHLVVISSDGNLIAAASADGTIVIWNANNGSLVKELISGSYVNDIRFNPQNDLIVSAHSNGAIILWDVINARPIQTLFHSKEEVYSAVFSPDGSLIVTTSENGTLKIWSALDGLLVKILRGHSDGVKSVAFSPDGKKIASASFDNTVIIWELESGMPLHILKKHLFWVNHVSFSPDGNSLLSASMDRTVVIWDVKTGECEKTINLFENMVYSAFFDPVDCNRIICASLGEGVQIVDIIENSVIWKTKEKGINSFSINNTGRFFAFSLQSGRIGVIDSFSYTSSMEWSCKEIFSIAYSPYTKHIVSASYVDHIVHIWHVTTGALFYSLKSSSKKVTSSSFNPDGSQIVVIAPDKKAVVLADVHKQHIIANYCCHQGLVNSVYFNHDGSLFVSAYDDGVIIISDANNGKTVWSCRQLDNIEEVFFSLDNKFLIVVSSNKGVKILNIDSRTCCMTINIDDEILDVAVSPRCCQIIVLPSNKANTITIWDIEARKMIAYIKEPYGRYFNSIDYSSDGKYIIATSFGCISVWDSNSGRCVHTIHDEGRLPWYVSASLSFDGKHIASFSRVDNLIRIWDFPSLQELIDQTRERFKDRPLTKEEKEQYYLE